MEWKKVASMEYGKNVLRSIPYHALVKDDLDINVLGEQTLSHVRLGTLTSYFAMPGYPWGLLGQQLKLLRLSTLQDQAWL